MADVTISSLPLGTPSGSGLIPYSQGGTTYSVSLSSLSNYKPMFFGSLTNGNATSENIIKINNVSVNRGNCYNSTTGQFTVPFDGVYKASANVIIGTGGAGYSQSDINLRKNGTVLINMLGAGTYWNNVSILYFVNAQKNDTIDFYGPTNVAGGGYIYGFGINGFSIEYVE